ncbi:MAG: cell division protein SepF [Armatimonadota bacterium]
MNRRQVADDDPEEQEVSEGWFARLRRRIGLDGYDNEDEEYEDESPLGPRGDRGSRVVVRVQNARPSEISVRLAPRTLNDAQAAADELKQRRPVILNLEQTDREVAHRLVDFISGVTYALDGYYQRVGKNVFLFTPSHISISVEDEIAQEQRKPFFERE